MNNKDAVERGVQTVEELTRALGKFLDEANIRFPQMMGTALFFFINNEDGHGVMTAVASDLDGQMIDGIRAWLDHAELQAGVEHDNN